MSFLSPLFFLGLAAIAIPVFVHLIQRERKRVIEFPSLMFLQRIPYQSVRRRRIRHWLLLLMRAAAIMLMVLAFARPFFPGGAAIAAAGGGSRDVIILLDQSASMGYGDTWDRAREAARQAVAEVGPNDRATLVLFSRSAEETVRGTSDRGRLEAAIDAAQITSSATQYGPALKLAENSLARSTRPQREVILISDFQRSGWTGAEDIRLGDAVTVTPVSVGAEDHANLAISSVAFARAEFSGQERITLTAGIANRSANEVADVPVTLEIEGLQLETQTVSVGANASASVVFAPFTLAEPVVRGTLHAGSDPLPADNTFHFVIMPSQPVHVLAIDSPDRAGSSFYLARALAVGNAPAFRLETASSTRATEAMLDTSAVVILNDAPIPLGISRDALMRYVQGGGGLLVALGPRSTWPSNEADLLPGLLGPPVDRAAGRGATLGFLDYSHPAFEVFKAPRSGDFSAARVDRYRALEPGADDRVLARFDDGTVAIAERRVGAGRVIAWTSTLDDSWNNLPLKPVYLPLIHQLMKYLARYEPPAAWLTVGQAVDVPALLKSRTDRVVIAPSNERIPMDADDPGLLEVNEHGVYEIRSASSGSSGRGTPLAVNIDPTESDLTPLDPQELVAAATGRATPTSTMVQEGPSTLAPLDAERQQGLWWYLLLAGLLLLAGETIVANRLSRHERFL